MAVIESGAPFMIHAIRPAAATIASKPMLDSMIIPHIIRVLFLVIILAQISALLAVQNRSAARVTTTNPSSSIPAPRVHPTSRRTVSIREHDGAISTKRPPIAWPLYTTTLHPAY